jgi:hypothetical protein
MDRKLRLSRFAINDTAGLPPCNEDANVKSIFEAPLVQVNTKERKTGSILSSYTKKPTKTAPRYGYLRLSVSGAKRREMRTSERNKDW